MSKVSIKYFTILFFEQIGVFMENTLELYSLTKRYVSRKSAKRP